MQTRLNAAVKAMAWSPHQVHLRPTLPCALPLLELGLVSPKQPKITKNGARRLRDGRHPGPMTGHQIHGPNPPRQRFRRILLVFGP